MTNWTKFFNNLESLFPIRGDKEMVKGMVQEHFPNVTDSVLEAAFEHIASNKKSGYHTFAEIKTVIGQYNSPAQRRNSVEGWRGIILQQLPCEAALTFFNDAYDCEVLGDRLFLRFETERQAKVAGQLHGLRAANAFGKNLYTFYVGERPDYQRASQQYARESFAIIRQNINKFMNSSF